MTHGAGFNVCSVAPGSWLNCSACGEWAHYDCDQREGLGSFKVPE